MLEILLIGAIDGNQSLKCTDLHAGADEDPCHFKSSYHLSEEKVDVFKHDIKPKGVKSKEVQRYIYI